VGIRKTVFPFGLLISEAGMKTGHVAVGNGDVIALTGFPADINMVLLDGEAFVIQSQIFRV